MAGKVVNRALLGFVLGMLAGVFAAIAVSFAAGEGTLILPDTLNKLGGNQVGALLLQMLVSGLFGIIPMVGTIVYEFDSWGMLEQAVVHYVSYTLPYLCLSSFLGWAGPNSGDPFLTAGLFAMCHGIIWLIMYARYRAEVKTLNELLSKTKTV